MEKSKRFYSRPKCAHKKKLNIHNYKINNFPRTSKITIFICQLSCYCTKALSVIKPTKILIVFKYYYKIITNQTNWFYDETCYVCKY